MSNKDTLPPSDEWIADLIEKHAGYGGDDIYAVVRAAIAAQAPTAPDGYKLLEDGKTVIPQDWTWCRLEYETQYPEDVAFGPVRMMNRLKKWLDAHFTTQANGVPLPVQAELAPDCVARLVREASGYIYEGSTAWDRENLQDCIAKLVAFAAQPAPAAPSELPVQAVHQFRKQDCSDWHDGHPDPGDGGGPYENRTLYTQKPAPVQAEPVPWGDVWLKHNDDLRYVRRVLESGRAMTDQDKRAAIDIVHGLRVIARARQPAPAAQEPLKPFFVTPLEEQQMFDDWCPYKGNPDPRVVWAAAVDAVNVMLAITGAAK